MAVELPPDEKAGSFHHDPADILRTSMDDMETQPMDLPAFDLSSMSLTLIVHRIISDVSDVIFFSVTYLVGSPGDLAKFTYQKMYLQSD